MLSLPKIEAVVSLKGQTSSISPTNLITPPRSGMYRAAVYVVVTSGTGAVDSNIHYTDAYAAEQQNVQSSASLGGPSSAVMVFQAEPSAPIQFDATLSGTATYNIDIVLESL